MHRCFNVTEILRNIFEQAFEDGKSRCCRKAVWSLSVACRAFRTVGREVLWSELHGLESLIKCMPDDLWETDGNPFAGEPVGIPDVKEPDTLISFARSPAPEDWVQFEYRAHFVKRFSWHQCFMQIDAETFRKISLHRPRTVCLFPNLQELCWKEWREDVYDYVNLFIGPKITRLELGQAEVSEDIHSVLRSLGAKCPLLEELNIEKPYFIHRSYHQFAVPSVSICALNRLRVANIPYPITVHEVVHLATLPALTEAQLMLNSTQDELCTHLSAVTIPLFPAIRILRISFVSLESPTLSIFNFINSTHLETVHLSSLEYPSANVVYKHLEVLSQHPCATRMTTLDLSFLWDCIRFSYAGKYPADLPMRILKLDALSPLLTMARLQDLTIASYYLDFDDDALATLAAALPQLHTLKLIPDYYAGKVSRVTLAGLIPLFQHCRGLHTLRLALDARSAVGLPATLPEGLKEVRLTALDVEDSPIVSPEAVAAFLAMFCHGAAPQLVFCAGYHIDALHLRQRAEFADLWGKVEMLLPLFIQTWKLALEAR
ncbi:hypothetical protein B0H21DRAFT_744843 [Amylocystis lapponica]|nr:hypothetical protein B0H21DRAFT_744843 [Amylocystis lapponica]